MMRVALPALGFAPVWRDAARRLASHRIEASQVLWQREGAGDDLFGGADANVAVTETSGDAPGELGPWPPRVPGGFLTLAGSVICHSDPQAPGLAYQALLRHQTARAALGNPADPLTRRLDQLAKAVRRDIHKMHAFVRFREWPAEGGRRQFGAWFEPDHLILEAATGFFARRFADMDWVIATPQGVARFAGGSLSYHPPAPPPELPQDAAEALWGTYFQNIFNPARVHLKAMRSEMPLKYWKNLPETRLIPEMLAGAEARVRAMREAAPAVVPARAARILARQDSASELPLAEPAMPATMDDARQSARACRRCALCEPATQTVWGEGDQGARLMIVGEQPGDHEDLAGRPFVGPAGRLLRDLMDEAGGEAGMGPVWLTNAVKHFKFTPRGKQRLHQNPTRGEISHCRWWLGVERQLIAPRLTLALGASAAFALTGDAAPLGARRGGIETAFDGGQVLLSWHPSAILRAREPQAGAQMRQDLLDDLGRASAICRDAP